MSSDNGNAAPTHLFIISNKPNKKLDVAIDYERRAHAARQSRKRAREDARRSQVKKSSNIQPALSVSQQQLSRFEGLALPQPLLADLVTLRSLSTGPDALPALALTRQHLIELYSRVDGLAFLKPADLYYEAARYAGLIYCDVLAQRMRTTDQGVSRYREDSVELAHVVDYTATEISLAGRPHRPSFALHYVLNSLFVDACWTANPDFMAWSFVLGYLGALQGGYGEAHTDQIWYREQLKQRRVCDGSVERLMRTLSGYLWFEDMALVSWLCDKISGAD